MKFSMLLMILFLANVLRSSPTQAQSEIFKPYHHDEALEEALMAHACVDNLKLYKTICYPGDETCDENEVNVIIMLKEDADLEDCIQKLIRDFPDLHFVRKYKTFKWVVATYHDSEN